jgi:hypothetical protein
VFYLPKEIARVSATVEDSAAQIDVERNYHLLFRQHGCYLASDLRPNRFAVRSEFARGVRYWPVAIATDDDAAASEDVKSWQKLFAGSPIQLFAIPVDEPHDDAARLRVRHFGELIRAAGGGLWNAVTAPPHPLYDGFVDVYITPDASSRPRFTYNGHPPQAGSNILDTDGIALRTWGWIAFLYDVELWYAWEGLYFSDRYNNGGPTDVLHDPLTFDQRRTGGTDFGNGDGILAYPGLLPSARLKALRRGQQDRLLLMKLASCGGDAKGLAQKLVGKALQDAPGQGAGSWPSDAARWDAARLELLDAIVSKCVAHD